jgi:hypothetical protein
MFLTLTTDFAFESLPHIILIQNALGSMLGPGTGYYDWIFVVDSAPPDKYRDYTLN